MFIDKFNLLCKEKGVKPSIALDEIDMARSNLSKWKKWKEDGYNDKLPYDSNLLKIADYFGVPVSYFSEDTKTPPTSSAEIGDIMKIYEMLTPERKQQFLDSMTALLKEQLQG